MLYLLNWKVDGGLSMNCDKCGKPNSPQAKFCGKCGFGFKALVSESAIVEKELSERSDSSSERALQRSLDENIEIKGTSSIESNLRDVISTPATDVAFEASDKAISEFNHSAGDLKSLINSQFNNNYSNQTAIKKYLDAHTEQLKAITFQLENIKNFQATINYELIINEINDKYKAIVQRMEDRDAGILTDPTQSLGSLLDDVDEKTHFLFEKINSLLISHNHHQNDSTFTLLEGQFNHQNSEIQAALNKSFENFETKAIQENINIEARLLDLVNEIKQQSKDADHELLERLNTLEELVGASGFSTSAEAGSINVDVISKQMKSLALTSHEKLANLISSSHTSLGIELASDLNEMIDERMKSLKLDLDKSLTEIKKDKTLTKEMFKSVVTPSEFNPEGSDGWITFLTGLLSGCAVVLASLAIYNFVSHSSDAQVEKAPKAAVSKSHKRE